MAKIKIACTALAAAALVAGCSKNDTVDAPAENTAAESAAAKDPNEVMVSVGEKNLTRGEIDQRVAEVLKKDGENIPAEQLDYQKRMIASQIAQSFIMDNTIAVKATRSATTISRPSPKSSSSSSRTVPTRRRQSTSLPTRCPSRRTS